MVKVESILEIIEDLENYFKLYEIEIRKLKIWMFCRQEVIYKLRNSILTSNQNSSVHNKKQKSSRYLALKQRFSKITSYMGSINKSINNYKKCDILCLSTNNLRREKINDKDFDIIFDYIGKYNPEISYAVLNTYNGKSYSKNSYSKYSYNMTNYSLKIYLYKKMHKKILKKDEFELICKKCESIEKYIFEEYDIKISIKDTVLQNTAALIKSYKYAYKVLNTVKPKVLYVECAYSNVHLPFIYGAKELGIKTVEFQHGLISKGHTGYSFNEGTESIQPVPDFICVYGQYFKKLIEDMNSGKNLNIIEYGYPYLYEKCVDVQNYKGKKEYDYLITTQGQYTYKQWNAFIKDLLEIDKTCTILVKLHPYEVNNLGEFYKDLLNEERVKFETKMNVYECFKICKRHLSVYSTCHFESIACGMETFVVKFPGWQHVMILKDYGINFINNAEELCECITSSKNKTLFGEFKKDFFNMEDVDIGKLKQKISKINKFFIEQC